MPRYVLVANPTAQSGKARARIDQALDTIEDRGIDVEFLPTEPGGRTIDAVAARLAAGACDVVISMGGDGTFREVATGLMRSGTDVLMGMIPSGTANDQGRSFGVSASPSALGRNLDIIEAGHVTRLDAGRIRCLDGRGAESTFFDSAGWGMQPDILAQRNRDREIVQELPILRELYRDQLVYAGAAIDRLIGSWVEPVKFTASVVADGQPVRYEGLTDLVVKGTAIYGGAWVLARESEPDDGLFELVPIQGRREWASKALRDLVALPIWQEHLDLAGVTHSEGVSASRFELTFEREEEGGAVSCQIDGEEWVPGNRFEIKVLHGAVRLLTPADFVPPWKIVRF